MSLIGSLEDLDLGDILQIIYLSQKSGALVIRSDAGEGRILFRQGLVCGGMLKSEPVDLRSLLVGGGFLDAADFGSIAECCGCEEGALEAALLARDLVTTERLDSLRRESVEAAVAAMFRWTSGEFSFDLERESESPDGQLMLAKGINPQFLAMERVRLEDESERGGEGFADEDDPNEMSAEEMFGVVSDAPDPAAAQIAAGDVVDAVAMLTAERVGGDRDDLESVAEPIPVAEQVVDASEEHAAKAPALAAAHAATVVIDPDLVALEWVKKTLEPAPHPIHIFQHGDLGLNRIRQYLVRGQLPMVLVSPAMPGDKATGIADATDFVRRLREQAPSMSIFWLCEEEGVGPPASHSADGVMMRPAGRSFRRPGSLRRVEELAVAFRAALLGDCAPLEPAVESPRDSEQPAKASSIERSLGDVRSQGEILPLVIRHARETFARVAMFMVRDDMVVGIAQSGLQSCGGPDDEGLRGMNFQGESSAWLRGVLNSRQPLVAPPQDNGDFELARALGELSAGEAYLAPVVSEGLVVAVLYGDNLPANQPIGDTSQVEVALEHAGLALGREVRQRTVADPV
jgi:hypothetical protein